ncbi:MAG TPA: class I SAM-dependent methyltransferase [Cyclobacteriaceae bacterium]|nr:class I SAM-dependent methyltransferase [Cyclobacteriaceae bacterium]
MLVCISGKALSQDQWKNVYTETAWAERDQWQKPEEIIKKMGAIPGSVVADVGCHEGYLTFKLSSAVGPSGQVYAVDVDQIRLDKLKLHAERAGAENIRIVKGIYSDPRLPQNTFDAVAILDSYHEMNEHDKILQHIKAALKPGGRLVICEPLSESRRTMQRNDQESKHELGINFAVADLQKAGFRIAYKKDPFIDREKIKGDKLWIIVAVKK